MIKRPETGQTIRRGRSTGKTKGSMIEMITVKRGEIYYADLSPVVGSEQGGIRPVLIIQNDVGNRYSPTVIAAAITSRLDKAKLPTHISLPSAGCGLRKDSVILLEQIRTIDKQRLKECMGEIPREVLREVDHALEVSFGLIPRPHRTHRPGRPVMYGTA